MNDSNRKTPNGLLFYDIQESPTGSCAPRSTRPVKAIGSTPPSAHSVTICTRSWLNWMRASRFISRCGARIKPERWAHTHHFFMKRLIKNSQLSQKSLEIFIPIKDARLAEEHAIVVGRYAVELRWGDGRLESVHCRERWATGGDGQGMWGVSRLTVELVPRASEVRY